LQSTAKRKLLQLASAMKHGGLARLLSILEERRRRGYSFRSLTYSWPKKLSLREDSSLPVRKHYVLPHLLSGKAYAGLKSILEWAQKDLEQGQRVHLVLHDFSGNLENFQTILGLSSADFAKVKSRLEITDFSEQSRLSMTCHPSDDFVATAWWTKATLDSAGVAPSRITYLIQDFEALFYDENDEVEAELRALALKSYQGVQKAKINSHWLKEYLVGQKILSPAAHLESFEPLIDPKLFRSDPALRKAKRIFVYARPEVRRNRFDLCVEALQLAAPEIPADWEIVGLGTLQTDWPLGSGRVLKAGKLLAFADYLKFLQSTPLSLTLMESPHPSHPPLEHAACGGQVVCNRFANKDYAQLGPQYLCSDLDAKLLAENLLRAVRKLESSW
jgi:hypothetical protein